MQRQVNRLKEEVVREREQGSQASSGPAGMPAKKIADTLGRRVTRNNQPMPLTSWPAASCASLRQVPTDSINVPLTKSRRMRKDEGKPGKKTSRQARLGGGT